MEVSPPHVVIVGGGISGLTAAYRIATSREDVQVTVLEKGDHPRGWLRTGELNGVQIELGPRSFQSRAYGVYTLSLCEDLGLVDDLLPSHSSSAKRFVYLNGRLNQMTLFWVVRFVGVWTLLRELLGACPCRHVEQREETVVDFVRRKFGDHLAPVAQAGVNGIFAGDAANLSMTACFPRVVEMEERSGSLVWDFIKSFFRRSVPPIRLTKTVQRLQKRSLYSFKKGMQYLPDKLADALQKLPNVRLECKVEVGCIVHDHGRPGVVLRGGRRIDGDILLSTLSPHCLTPLIASLPSQHPEAGVATSFLSSIPHSSVTFVSFAGPISAIKIPAKYRGFGFLVPNTTGEDEILGCTFDSLTFPGHNEGRLVDGEIPVAITVMLGGELRSKDWLRGIDPISVAVKGVKKYADIDIDMDRVGVKTGTIWDGIPQYRLGHDKGVQATSRVLEGMGILIAGMGIMGPGVNNCVAAATRAAHACCQRLPPPLLRSS